MGKYSTTSVINFATADYPGADYQSNYRLILCCDPGALMGSKVSGDVLTFDSVGGGRGGGVRVEMYVLSDYVWCLLS